MEDLLLTHFQTYYQVYIGHPTDGSEPATNLIYYNIGRKDLTNIRGKMNDDEWVENVLREIGEKMTTQLFMLVISVSNKFIKTISEQIN